MSHESLGLVFKPFDEWPTGCEMYRARQREGGDLDIVAQFPARAELTPREHHVLGQLLRGLSVADTASELGIAPSTARMHIKRLHEKTATTNLHSLALWGVAHAECCVQER